jgi:hypothetical protein
VARVIAVIGGVTALRAGYRHDHGVAVVPRALRRLVCWTVAFAAEFLCWSVFPLLGLLIFPFVFLYVVALCTICPQVNDFYRSRKKGRGSPVVVNYYAV